MAEHQNKTPDNSRTMARAMQFAFRYKDEHPLKVGDTVAQPDNPLALDIREVYEDSQEAKVIGIVNAETGEVGTRNFSLSELFDVNVALQAAEHLRREEVLMGA